MATKVSGASDDLIEVDGDICGEVGFFCGTHAEVCLLFFSDGTILAVSYGKLVQGIWEVKLIAKGSQFIRIEPCMDADADPYSDVAEFADGLKWAYAATQWERVK